jgi:hypothetical protein
MADEIVNVQVIEEEENMEEEEEMVQVVDEEEAEEAANPELIAVRERAHLLDAHLDYAIEAARQRELRLEQIRNQSEIERRVLENEEKEKELFRANARDICDLLSGNVFYVHRKVATSETNLNPTTRARCEFVFSNTVRTMPGELACMVKGDEFVVRPWNVSDPEIRFIIPETLEAIRNRSYSQNHIQNQQRPNNNNAAAIQTQAALKSGGAQGNPRFVRMKNRTIDTRVYGGARHPVAGPLSLSPPSSSPPTTTVPSLLSRNLLVSPAEVRRQNVARIKSMRNNSKRFPGNRLARDYPVEISYSHGRTPLATPLRIDSALVMESPDNSTAVPR